MKSVLKVISWTLFFIAAIAAFLALSCTIGGAIVFILALCAAGFAEIFAYLAIGYYISVIVIILFCIVLGIYELVMRVRTDKNALHSKVS